MLGITVRESVSFTVKMGTLFAGLIVVWGAITLDDIHKGATSSVNSLPKYMQGAAIEKMEEVKHDPIKWHTITGEVPILKLANKEYQTVLSIIESKKPEDIDLNDVININARFVNIENNLKKIKEIPTSPLDEQVEKGKKDWESIRKARFGM